MALAPETRPVLRGDCGGVARPCPWEGCRYQLGLEATESCALDVADRGDHDREEVATILGLSPEAVAEIEADAFEHAAEVCQQLGIEPEDLVLAEASDHMAQAMDCNAEASASRYLGGYWQAAVGELAAVVEAVLMAPLTGLEKEKAMDETLELAARIEGAAKLRKREELARVKLAAAREEMEQVCAEKESALRGLLEHPAVAAFLTLVHERADGEEPEPPAPTDAGKLKAWLLANPGRTFTRRELCEETGVAVSVAAPYLTEWTGTLVRHPGKGMWVSTAVRPGGEKREGTGAA